MLDSSVVMLLQMIFTLLWGGACFIIPMVLGMAVIILPGMYLLRFLFGEKLMAMSGALAILGMALETTKRRK